MTDYDRDKPLSEEERKKRLFEKICDVIETLADDEGYPDEEIIKDKVDLFLEKFPSYTDVEWDKVKAEVLVRYPQEEEEEA